MAAAPLNALGRHLALTGFMGAGKSTVGSRVAERLGRPFVDLDAEIERHTSRTIAEIFAEDGEAAFRAVEEGVAHEVLGRADPAVVALGGGAVVSSATRQALGARAFTVFLETSPETAWERSQASGRPLARDETAFLALYEARRPVYEDVADACASDLDDVLLHAAGIHVGVGAVESMADLVPGDGPIEIVIDRHVSGIHGVTVQLGLGSRDVAIHELPPGEAAKTVAVLEQVWESLRIGRDGVVVAVGGGATTDVAGFAAATYMRGVPWVPVPTTVVGQVDAAIGGKTAIDVPGGKNLVGAFHWPARVICDPTLLETLPDEERRNGMAEVVKTGLLAGSHLWELSGPAQVRACAAFKGAVCLADPHDRGRRAQLNLGHTFAHALEAASGYRLSHGHAVALGLLAALRLSGLDEERRLVEHVLAPAPARVDRDVAWAAIARDKKAAGGRPRLVLLDAPGSPRWGVELPDDDVRAALDAVIAS